MLIPAYAQLVIQETIVRPTIDECALVSCLNGGSCEDGINDYTCHCVAGYTEKTVK